MSISQCQMSPYRVSQSFLYKADLGVKLRLEVRLSPSSFTILDGQPPPGYAQKALRLKVRAVGLPE